MPDDPPEGEVAAELSRDMSLGGVVAIGVGAMIGAGVFALTGYAAGIAGPALLLAFLLNGLVAITTAMAYAELGAAFPEAGGGYLWVKEALPDPNGFFAGWMSWFAHAVACSLYAVTFGVFFTELLVALLGWPEGFVLGGLVTRHALELGLAVVMAVLFGVINLRGASETGRTAVLVAAVKVLILLAFIAFGAWATLTAPNWTSRFLGGAGFAPNGVAGILGAMGFTYIAFEGYEIIVQSGEEVVDPGTNIPKAIFYSLAIVVPIYILVAFAAIGGIDVTQRVLDLAGMTGAVGSVASWQVLGQLGELGLIRAANQFMPFGTAILLFAGLVATMSALNATVYSSSRVSFAMSRDRALPSVLERIHGRYRTPHVAIIASVAFIILLAVLLPIESVAAAADIMFILLFVQVNVTVLQMRRTHANLERPFRVPFLPWLPLAGIVLQLLLTPFLLLELGLSPGQEGFDALLATGVWMVAGIIVYLAYAKPREEARLEQEAPVAVLERSGEERPATVLVPVANPATREQLVRTAIDVARARDAQVLVMTVVTVPAQLPVSEGHRFVDEQRPLLREAMDQVERAGVPVGGTIRVGHSVARAILNTVRDHDVDTVVMGWTGKPRRRDVVLGSTLDDVVRLAPCEVLVERVGQTVEPRSILVPTTGGPHSPYAARVAAAIASANAARVELLTVVRSDADEEERQEARSHLEAAREALGDAAADVYPHLVEAESILEAILDRAAENDLTIVGATREGLLQRLLFGAIPEEVGRRAPGGVIMARKHEGVRGAFTTWFGRWGAP